MYRFIKQIMLLALLCLLPGVAQAQHSVAREWNELMLQAIRHDVPRPTVHARNLFHVSAAMYDAWAAYDNVALPFLLGRTVGGFTCSFDGVAIPSDPAELAEARNEAVSYASFRLLVHRFQNSPGAPAALASFDSLMTALGYDVNYTGVDYVSGPPAALGNYVAQCVIDFGMADYSNEAGNFADDFYEPFNPPLAPAEPGNPQIIDMNRWQPLELMPGQIPKFLSPHWGEVTPFALNVDDLVIYHRNGDPYWVYNDPGHPAYLDSSGTVGLDDYYKWNFALVSVWSGQLDPNLPAMLDISPASMGNNPPLPEDESGMRDFYKLLDGGDSSQGYDINPATGLPYEEQLVPLGDFGRVIAEFWADGPASETPPGHWFTLLNYVSDHPLFEKRFEGQGDILADLEWDVKSYLATGGAVHDVAVAVWGIKSWYDYIRPISSIRAMAEFGQSSDPNLASYHPAGLPLIDGYIDLVEMGDSLAGDNNENVGKIKIFAWRGPDYIGDPATTFAGVGWILAENWWPYQRPSFITPPFAGYVSGHSTFSRAAAEVMTRLTGDPYFPGGYGEFIAEQNEYLVFEDGPSVEIRLQWATYRDASDQASLSRLWGGIHPPLDDIPGRKIGIAAGNQAFEFAAQLYAGQITDIDAPVAAGLPADFELAQNYPNPFNPSTTIRYSLPADSKAHLAVYDVSGALVTTLLDNRVSAGVHQTVWDGRNQYGQQVASGVYFYRLISPESNVHLSRKMLLVR